MILWSEVTCCPPFWIIILPYCTTSQAGLTAQTPLHDIVVKEKYTRIHCSCVILSTCIVKYFQRQKNWAILLVTFLHIREYPRCQTACFWSKYLKAVQYITMEPPCNRQLGTTVECPLFGGVRCIEVSYFSACYNFQYNGYCSFGIIMFQWSNSCDTSSRFALFLRLSSPLYVEISCTVHYSNNIVTSLEHL